MPNNSLTINNPPPLGVIEGFFGRAWTQQARERLLEFMAEFAYDYYIYAPKNDPYLRRNWQQPYPSELMARITQLALSAQRKGLAFGVGLSPFEAYLLPQKEAAILLQQKITELNHLNADYLCILFDDMRGDIQDLAQRQIELTDTILKHTNANRVIFCPTYYSTDPILEKVFGNCPDHYFDDLKEGLDARIELFWTGPNVCSSEYSLTHLEEARIRLGRKPWLWDNYPVNDGAVKAQRLHLKPVPASHGKIWQNINGHSVNPMNQPLLSRLAMASVAAARTLGESYQPESIHRDIAYRIYGEALGNALLEDTNCFQEHGLGTFDQQQKAFWLKKYRALEAATPDQGAQEVVDWLNGEYTFDPACLTD